MDEHATALVTAIEAALPAWVVTSVERVLDAWQGGPTDGQRLAAAEAGVQAAADVGAQLRSLLALDVDEQRDTPLTLIRRSAVPHVTAVLRDAGVPPVVRDEFREHAFPDDDYDVAPATWSDLSLDVAAAGMAWGAWKAMTVKARHARAEHP